MATVRRSAWRPTIDPSESLTLDDEARTRAADALTMPGNGRNHTCGDYDDGDGCEICWALAGDIIRAAEGLRLCLCCNGMGMIGPEGDWCPTCGGNGLEVVA